MPPLVFPQESTAAVLQLILDQMTLTLRLYSNNKTPQPTDDLSSYVEVTGGGYAAVALNAASWAVSQGSPSVALYNAFIDFIFTSATTGPGTIYGYYLTNQDDVVLYAEEFDPADIPFTPTDAGAGTSANILQIRPRFGADNLIAPPVEIE